MKIKSAWVDDPTLEGEIESPILCVEVTEYPDQTSPSDVSKDGWTQTKYGPFIQFDFEPNADIDAGDYNIRFAGVLPPIVDIVLVVDGRHYVGMFGLYLRRARALLRKHASDWRLYLSDKDAMEGSLLWVPQQAVAHCRHWMPGFTCNNATRTVFIQIKGVYVPLCPEHLIAHNNKNAESRRTSK